MRCIEEILNLNLNKVQVNKIPTESNNQRKFKINKMVQAVVSSKGEAASAEQQRPALQGRGMIRTEATRRPQNAGRQSAAAAAQGNYELNSGSMFQFGADAKQGAGAASNINDGAINLKMRQLYGVNPKVRPSVLAIDDSQIVYVCGHNTVLYNTENKAYRFIQGVEGTQGVTAMAVSHNKKYLAICERSQQAICFIYEVSSLKRRRIITSSESVAKEFIDVKFAYSDEKLTNFLFTLTGEPDYRLVIWLWDKQRFVAQLKFDVEVATKNCIPNQASFNPHNQLSEAQCALLILGSNCYKYYKLGDNGAWQQRSNALTKKDATLYSLNYTCHAWVGDFLLVCTDRGEILFCDQNCEFKFCLLDSPGQNFKILNILALKQDDFIIADASGSFCHYESTGEMRNPFKLFKNNLPVAVDQDETKWNKYLEEQDSAPYFPITGMEQVGDFLVYTTTKRQILKMRIQKEKSDDFGRISYLTIPFHRQKLTAVATCLKQQILATAASDQTLMVWSYTTHPGSLSLQIVKQLQDPILAVAFHPSGFYVVIAHPDRVRIYTVHPDDIAVAQFAIHEIRGCTEIQFSHGGHLFVLNDENGTISVFKFWQNERIPQEYKQLKPKGPGHEPGMPIRSLLWMEDDTGFISVGRDDRKVVLWRLKPKIFKENDPNKAKNQEEEGSVIQWQYEDPSRDLLNQFLDCQVCEEAADKNGEPAKIVIFASSKEGDIRELLESRSRQKFVTNFAYSQLRYVEGYKAFFAGVSSPNHPGAIHVLPYPFNDQRRIQEIQIHDSPVTKLVLNHEKNLLFSGAEDGSLAIMAITDRPKVSGTIKDVSQIQEVLIQGKLQRQLLEEIHLTQEELEERKRDSDDRIKSLRDAKERERQSLTNQLAFEEQKLNAELNEKQREKDETMRYQVEKRKEMEELHARQLLQMKKEHDRKKASDEEKFQALLEQKDLAAEDFSNTIRQLKIEQEKLLDDMAADHDNQLQQAKEEVTMLREKERREQESIIEKRRDAEENAWNQIDIMTDKNKDVLAESIERGLENKAELTKQMRELTAQNLERNNKAKDLQEKKNQLDTKMIQQQKIKSDIHACEQQYKARINTISEKDIQIQQLYKKIQELEKFKFVLDYKIKELKRDICPKEVQIQKLNEQTAKMRSEQKHFDRVNQNLVLIVDDLRMRQEGLTKSASQMESKILRQENTMKKFRDDVQQMLFKPSLTHKELKKGVVRLYRTWVLDERVNDTGTTDVYQIYNTQRTQIENNVKTLQEKLMKETRKHTQENNRILKENVQLIKELNQLRAEEQKLKISVRQVLANIKIAGGMKGAAPTNSTSMNFNDASQQSFTQKRLRVQSAVNTRTREVAAARKEKEQMEAEANRHKMELDEIQLRNKELRQLIDQKHQQQQFQQQEGEGEPDGVAPADLHQQQHQVQQQHVPDFNIMPPDDGSRQPMDLHRNARPSSQYQDIDGVPIQQPGSSSDHQQDDDDGHQQQQHMGEPSHLQQETSSPEHRQPDGGEEDMDEEEDMDDDEPMQDHDGQAIAAAADPDNANAAGREDDEAEEI